MSSQIAFGGSLFFWESKRKVKGWYEELSELNQYTILFVYL